MKHPEDGTLGSQNSDLFDETLAGNIELFFRPADDVHEAEGSFATIESSVITQEMQITPPITTKHDSKREKKPIGLSFFGKIIAVVLVANGLASVVNKESQSVETIKINTLPRYLPPAVKSELGNVGILSDEVYASKSIAGSSSNYETSHWVNAIAVSPTLAVAEGELIAVSSHSIHTKEQCQQVTFSNVDSEYFIAQGHGTTSPNVYSNIPDFQTLGLALDQNAGSLYQSLPNIPIAPMPPTPGEALYFVNFENNANNGQISYDGPAVYGGIFAEYSTGGKYDVITGLKSYGKSHEDSSIDGAQNGAVLNSKGQLVGLVEGWSDKATSVAKFNQWLGLNLSGYSAGKKITDTIVEPVTDKLLKSYEKNNGPIKQDCFTIPEVY